MAASGENELAPIESRDELVTYIEQGEKPKAQWRIGTEHEKFPFYREGLRPVPYEGPAGIRALLEGMAEKSGWRPIYDLEHVIALEDPPARLAARSRLSLAGSSSFPVRLCRRFSRPARRFDKHLQLVREVADPLGISFLGLGSSPLWTRAETPRMPKSRYAIMTAYMPKVGKLGLDMMYRSCTVQVNLDFGDEADMVKKLRVSLALQPVAAALFANSPFTEGKPNGYLSFRSAIWLDTDAARSGMLPFAFEDGMGYERYVDYALDVPMYFVRRDNRYIDAAGASFQDFLAGRLPQLPGEKPTLSDWADHLTTLFPEVRLKRFLEMRGADAGSSRVLCALPAFWTGLLYHQPSLDAAYDLVKDWTAEERQQLRNEVPRLALKTPFRDGAVLGVAREAVNLAAAGLKARGHTDLITGDESIFLQPLAEIVESGKTDAERLLERYHGEWGGDVRPVFVESAY